MTSIEDQLKAYGAWVKETQHREAATETPLTTPLRQPPFPHRWLVAAAAAVVVVLVIGVVVFNQDDEPQGLVTEPPSDSTFGYGPGWHDLDSGPLSPRLGAATVWTDEELYIIGGAAEDGTLLTDGAAYDPATRTWRALADIPDPGDDLGGSFDAVWTGEEVLLAYQSGFTQASLPAQQTRRVASYDPTSDAWTAAGSWTDGETMTFGVTGYDLHWTGEELLFPDALMAYDPSTDTYRELYTDAERVIRLPDGVDNYFIPEHPRRSAWTGTELMIFDGSGLGAETIAIDTATGTKRELAPRLGVPPISAPQMSDDPDSQPTDDDLNELGAAVWHDGRIVDVDTFGRIATYDIDADRWTIARLPGASDDQLCAPEAMVISDRVIVDHCGSLYAESEGEWSLLTDESGCCWSPARSTGATILRWAGFEYLGGEAGPFETSFRIWVPATNATADSVATTADISTSPPSTSTGLPVGATTIDVTDPDATAPDDNCPEPQPEEPTRAFLRLPSATEPEGAPWVRVEYPAYPGSTVGGVLTITRPDGGTFEAESADIRESTDGDAELYPLTQPKEFLVSEEGTYVYRLQLQFIVASQESPDGMIQSLTGHRETDAHEVTVTDELEFVIDPDGTPPGSCASYSETSD